MSSASTWLAAISRDLLNPTPLATSINAVTVADHGPTEHLMIIATEGQTEYTICFDVAELFEYLSETIDDLEPGISFPGESSGATVVASLIEELIVTGEISPGVISHPEL